VTIFAVNRDRQEPLELNADLRALPDHRVEEHLVLSDEDVRASNTAEDPDRVRPRTHSGAEVVAGRLQVVLPRLSWNVIQLSRLATG
jgi:alpha-L-arabinofuranosidase